jgi:hypothetical protein
VIETIIEKFPRIPAHISERMNPSFMAFPQNL